MDDAKFDRLARALEKTGNRRWLVALASGATGILAQRGVRGAQLGPATCGEQGAVCTLITGCCSGLTCATSAINTGYGICVPGEGGMVSTGTTLVSPFSETAVEDVTDLVQAAPTAPAIDPRAERQARLAELRARKDARRTREKTRLDTRRTEAQTRQEEKRARQQTRKEEKLERQQIRKDEKRERQLTRKEEKRNRQLETREAAEVALGPQLELELQFSKADGDSELAGEQLVPIEEVRATNRDDVDIVLTRIETLQGSINGADLTTSQFTIGPGESYLFVSGLPTQDAADAANDQYRWLNKVACDQTVEGQGFRVKAAFSRDTENHEFMVFCDGPYSAGVTEAPPESPSPKGKQNNQRLKKKR